MYINKRILAGNLGADARQFPATGSGKVKFTFSTAQTRNFKKPDGKFGEITEWTDCVLWVKADQADSYSRRLVKGASVYIEGRHDIVKREVNGEDRTFHEVNVNELQFFARSAKSDSAAPAVNSKPQQSSESTEAAHADVFRPAAF